MSLSNDEEPDRKRVRFGHDSLSQPNVQIQSESKNGSIRANEAIELRFITSAQDIHPDDAADPHPSNLKCHPTYLHQIIPNERILGYSSINVAIYVHAASLLTWISVHKNLSNQSNDQVQSSDQPSGKQDQNDDNNDAENNSNKTQSKVVPTNVEALMSPFIKSGRSTTKSAYLEALSTPFTMPLTNRIAQYEKDGHHYGIYKEKFFVQDQQGTHIKRDDFHAYHLRMAFLMFIHIDGASFIDDDDPRWEVFVVAEEVNDTPIAFIGYATIYPFSALQVLGSKSISFAERIRISQVFISPLAQGKGHGSQLLKNIYKDAIDRKAAEITVEDPSLGFRLLRDVTDLRIIYNKSLLDSNNLYDYNDLDRHVLEVRKSLLLTNAQARRCVEIHQLRCIERENEEQYKKYRLSVKRRLYKENLEILDQYDPDEKKKKLAEIYEEYEKEYVEAVRVINNRLEKTNTTS